MSRGVSDRPDPSGSEDTQAAESREAERLREIESAAYEEQRLLDHEAAEQRLAQSRQDAARPVE